MVTKNGMNSMNKLNVNSKYFLVLCSLVLAMSTSEAVAVVSPTTSLNNQTGKTKEDGFNYEVTQMNKLLNRKETELNKTFDFFQLSKNEQLPPAIVCKDKNNQLVIDFKFDSYDGLLCVVLQKTTSLYTDKNKLNNNDDTDSYSEKEVQNNRKVFSWKDILIIPATENNQVENTVEFNAGQDMANELMKKNLEKLTEIYAGMITYRALELSGLIKALK